MKQKWFIEYKKNKFAFHTDSCGSFDSKEQAKTYAEKQGFIIVDIYKL